MPALPAADRSGNHSDLSGPTLAITPAASPPLPPSSPATRGHHSMCCRTNDTTPDNCRPDGLCQDTIETQRLVWRESCTDPTWRAAECLKLCIGVDSTRSSVTLSLNKVNMDRWRGRRDLHFARSLLRPKCLLRPPEDSLL
jgi:hypothetical protein